MQSFDRHLSTAFNLMSEIDNLIDELEGIVSDSDNKKSQKESTSHRSRSIGNELAVAQGVH